uniref:Uncharacterized protein n=2 Tax=Vibrio TaxID=662 RepID=A0A0H3ZKH2_9VIBR|nr:hypothetical protein [Vibrio tasmaniensis]AKN38367.1 hypothetical protein [Vibrio sp. FF_371]
MFWLDVLPAQQTHPKNRCSLLRLLQRRTPPKGRRSYKNND